MSVGDADRDLLVNLPDDGNATEINIPAKEVLHARINAYKANNEHLEREVKELKEKDSGRIKKYKRIISLCTRVDEGEVDKLVGRLARALESERGEVEMGRVRELLGKFEGI
jgi:regulatory protein SWI6